MLKDCMNLLIPYKHTKDDGLELKYSIRSMVKHFKDLHRVIVVGDLPSWFIGIHIQAGDIPKHRELSVLRKIKKVDGVIMYSMDDVFALRDFSSDLPNYYDGLCGSKNPIDRTYKEFYKDCPREWKSFEVHCPMVIDTSLLTWDDDRLLKTWYANTNKLPGVELPDCKLKGEMSYNDIKDEIKDKPFFSTKDNIHRGGMMRVMNELYPEKSKFEI